MAKTFARENGANVAIKLNGFGLTECNKCQGEKSEITFNEEMMGRNLYAFRQKVY